MPRLTPEGGAVTANTASVRTVEPVSVGSLTFISAQSCPIELDGGKPLLLLVSFLATNSSGAERTYTARVTLNGAPASADLVAKLANGINLQPVTFHFYSDGASIPKGTHTFAVEVKSDDVTAAQEWSECRLTIWEA